MKVKRGRWIILLSAATLVLTIVTGVLWPSDEPVYRGKPVSTWFEEYVRGPSVPGSGVLVLRSPTGRVFVDATTEKQIPDPAWEALRALGSNAVPYLARRVRTTMWERPRYQRIFAKLPATIRAKVPNPARNAIYRHFAIQAVNGLGTESVDAVLLELGSQHRYKDVVEIAKQCNWQGEDVAGLLGKILLSSDPALRREAISLLERSGAEASPALDRIVGALKYPDGEVRYLAARSIENIGNNSPGVIAALLMSLNDENVMVQNVARRTLLKFSPETPGSKPVQPANNL